jgi:hypothetical protein
VNAIVAPGVPVLNCEPLGPLIVTLQESTAATAVLLVTVSERAPVSGEVVGFSHATTPRRSNAWTRRTRAERRDDIVRGI